ncbi:hypothetical protein DCO58_01375 [Helicobacter saguini]|uniref:Uncharacterized protein n=1 Tax=Helicobacter saguini TaxID=1548018 RepID=A0A347VRB5_9HELI|nr:GTPase domain-containing protein [Helicobacter saguini]MWV62964.1 hypothetical protein [Helicobacter saguini]MWV66366.1 hypothetical protein [Helicobacter saguini]MWV68719.1 hypothetical protein [Helicobacter saguini]MWV71730.1 hypothetical protein [Helicobacter saguini]TLD92173.1 hypothetical protein LS64_010815 [Helicobacter saguini]
MQADSIKGHQKLFIIGNKGVGKSALISHLLGRNIKPAKVQITLFQREQKWHAGIIRDYYLVKLGLKESDFLQSVSESDDKVCYVFNAAKYDFNEIMKDLESIVNLAKAKGLKLRVLGTFGSFLDLTKKDSILQEIKTFLESILGKNTCEIYADSPLPCGGGLGGWVNSTSNNHETIESTNTNSKDSNNIESKPNNQNAPYSFKDKNTKLAIFELIESSYNKDEATNAKLLKEKLKDFLNFGPPPPNYLAIG